MVISFVLNIILYLALKYELVNVHCPKFWNLFSLICLIEQKKKNHFLLCFDTSCLGKVGNYFILKQSKVRQVIEVKQSKDIFFNIYKGIADCLIIPSIVNRYSIIIFLIPEPPKQATF